MEAKALTTSVRIRASVTSTATTPAVGTMTETFGSLPMASAAVTENTNTPTASPNVRHTIGSSRNRFSRGDRLPNAHCATRKSSAKMRLTSPRTPKPTPTSVSVTRVLAIGLGGDPRQQQPETQPGHHAEQLHQAGPHPAARSGEPACNDGRAHAPILAISGQDAQEARAQDRSRRPYVRRVPGPFGPIRLGFRRIQRRRAVTIQARER